MKVYMVSTYMLGEDDQVMAIFSSKESASNYAEECEGLDAYGYQYFVSEWGVRE